ncbi:cytochrome P450 98A3, partial [Ephemerocybe angulata]
MIDIFQYPKTVTLLLLVLQGLLRQVLTRRKRLGASLPPGPKGLPLIGNLYDMPTSTRPELAYSELARQYGDMVYLETLGTKILVLSSLKRTTDLFERRSTIYSDRHRSPMLNKEMGYEAYFSLMPYGALWRRQRKLFHEYFNPTAVKRYHSMILEERLAFVEDLLNDPKSFSQRTRSYFTRVILRSTYGIQPKGNDDPFITQPAITVEGFNTVALTGTFMVDLIPALSYVPDSLPFTGWKKVAKFYRESSLESRISPFEYVCELHRQGVAPESAARSMIEKLPNREDPGYNEAFICAQDTTAVSYIGGSDTSLGAARSTLLLLAKNIDAQKRAQEELDEVVGPDRLPDFNDRPRLVYVNALIMEIMRMHQQLPIGLPHTSTEDDIYDGYFIPKGTLVFGNSWHILHDPNVFQDPFTFNPDRFIKNGELDKHVMNPFSAAFGYGRRICPGRHISLDSLYAMVTSTLALFNIYPPKNKHGTPVLLNEDFTDGVMPALKPFDLDISPRSPQHEEFLRGLAASL